ncbi:SH3 domain-containing protein [uncultured Roseibium sp.]|uniref:SH3 domain-containing protein n=1 Tax=uncultured Roseibium sp. TaxID=1936171 RepID=UPI00262633F1|nr:SH3 domain-containing protein [uncultured Roseibium sp.]
MRSVKRLLNSLAAVFAAVSLLGAPLTQAQSLDAGDGFRSLRVAPGVSVADEMIDLVLPFLRGHPERDEGNGSMQMSIRKQDDGYAVNIVMTGYLDDSLYGEHFRGYVIALPDDRWELLSMSVKPLCARGRNVNGFCENTPAGERILAPDALPTGPAMCVKVALDDTLNLRSGPGTRHPVVGSLVADDCAIELFDICEGNWCQIRSGRISGWVNTRYLVPMN